MSYISPVYVHSLGNKRFSMKTLATIAAVGTAATVAGVVAAPAIAGAALGAAGFTASRVAAGSAAAAVQSTFYGGYVAAGSFLLFVRAQVPLGQSVQQQLVSLVEELEYLESLQPGEALSYL